MRGQIGLIRGVGFLPGVVRVATGGSISHVIIGVGNGQAISPQLGGAVIREVYSFPEVYWSDYPLTALEEDTIVDFARSREGTPYNVLGAAALAATRFQYLARFHYPRSSYAYYHCAQLARDAYLAAGIDPTPSKTHPGPISPYHFEAEYRARGWDLGTVPRRAVPNP